MVYLSRELFKIIISSAHEGFSQDDVNNEKYEK